MDAYLAQMLPLRDAFVRLGLECDSDGRGGLTLLDEDRGHWDWLIGAVHWIPDFDPATATAVQRKRAFMAASESVARAGVDALAHPFRYFRRGRMDAPRDLHRPMARMLADAGVAAEINFHTHAPDPRFIAACLAEGVGIALATDSHRRALAPPRRPPRGRLPRRGLAGRSCRPLTPGTASGARRFMRS